MGKDYRANTLQFIVKLELGNLHVSDYTRKFDDYHSFGKTEISEKFATYLFLMAIRCGPSREDLMSAYSIGKLNSL